MQRALVTKHILRKGIITIAVVAYTVYVYAFSTGITGRTQKNGVGCTCHGGTPTAGVTVSIDGPDTLAPSQTAKYTVTISGGPASEAGTDIAASEGTLTAVSSTLQKVGDELTHLAPVTFEGSTVTFSFQYTAPDTDGIQTLYATGNSVDNSDDQFGDQWNFAPNKQVVIFTPPPPTTTTVYDSLRGLWNLVSLPVGVTNRFKDTLFPSAISNAFGYNGAYYTEDSLSQGVGYWLKFDSTQVVQLTGAIVSEETVDVVDSWNLIGSISTSIAVSSLSSDPPGILSSSVFGYEGSYVNATEITPGKGYWVKTSGAGKIILSSSSAVPKSSNSIASDLHRMNSVTLTDRAGHRQTLYFGMRDDVRSSMRFFELPPPPPQGGFDVRFTSQRMLEVVKKGEVQEFPLAISSAEYPLKVTWKLSNRAVTASLIDDDSRIPMTTEGAAVITSPNASLVLKVTTGVSSPAGFALHPGYPNPFNPTTTISYDIARQSFVSISVYDVLGKEVRTLIADEKTSGTHIIRWDGNDNDGLASPSGIYFVKFNTVSADDETRHAFTATQKIMLLR